MSTSHWVETLRTVYERDLRRELALQHPHHAHAIESRDLCALPTPVRNFVAASGVVDAPRATNARVVWRDMELRDAPGKAWMAVECEQVNFLRQPARFALMRSRIAKLLPFSGYDRYRNANARFFINIAGTLPLRRADGPHFDDSALVTYLSEAMLLPVLMIDPRVHWLALDEGSARASMQHGSSSVAGVFTFDPSRDSVRFETDDRWRDGSTPTRTRWSAEVRSFAWHKGMRVPGEATARWHTDAGPFVYMRGSVESISYDVTDERAMVAPHWLPRPRSLAQGLLSLRSGAQRARRHG